VFDEQFTSILTFLTGLGSGAYVGIASGTAEPFIIPLMTIIIGSTVYQAIGTNLFVDGAIGFAAGIIFLLRGHVKLKPVLVLAICGMVFAFIGSFFSTGTKESDLKFLIAIILVFFGLMLIRGGVKKNIEMVEKRVNVNVFRNNKLTTFLFFGSIIGFLSGFVGMGSSGAITILLIFVLGYDLHTSIGTSLMMMSGIAFSGAFAHGFILGDIVIESALIAGAGAIIGEFFGSTFANKVNEELLGRVIGGIITILGCVIFVEIFLSYYG
jgi:uncharacterized membrane protein YfcA